MKISLKKINLLLIGMLVLVFNLLFLATVMQGVSDGWEWRCAIVALVNIIYYIATWKVMGFRWASPKFFVLFSFIMFHISSVIVIGWDKHFYGVSYTTNQMLYRYGEYWGFWGTVYALLFVFVYVIGIILFSKPDYDKKASILAHEYRKQDLEICRQVGVILLAISILPELYHDAMQIFAKVEGGYQAMFEADTTFHGIPLGWFTKLFLPGILLLLSSYREDKKKFIRIMLIASVYFLVFMFFTGRKGNTIQTLVPFVLMYCYFFKPKFKWYYIPIGYFGAFLTTIVTHTRELAVNNQFWSNLKEVIIESEPIKDLSLEMGGTVKAIIQALMSIPDTGDFQYGRTYLVSIVYSILSGLNMPVSSLEEYALFNIYLSQPERGSYINSTVFAMGGSAIAEWYWNFGWGGIPLVIVFAYFIIKYEKYLISIINKPIVFAVATSFLYYLMRYTRGYFNEIIWQPLYIIVFVWIVYSILTLNQPKRNIVREE